MFCQSFIFATIILLARIIIIDCVLYILAQHNIVTYQKTFHNIISSPLTMLQYHL